MIFVWIEVTRDDSSVTEPESKKILNLISGFFHHEPSP